MLCVSPSPEALPLPCRPWPPASVCSSSLPPCLQPAALFSILCATAGPRRRCRLSPLRSGPQHREADGRAASHKPGKGRKPLCAWRRHLGILFRRILCASIAPSRFHHHQPRDHHLLPRHTPKPPAARPSGTRQSFPLYHAPKTQLTLPYTAPKHEPRSHATAAAPAATPAATVSAAA